MDICLTAFSNCRLWFTLSTVGHWISENIQREIKGRAGKAVSTTCYRNTSAQARVRFLLGTTRGAGKHHDLILVSFCCNIKAKSPPLPRAMPVSQKAHFSESKLGRCQRNLCWYFVSCYFSILCLIYSFWFYVFWHSQVYVGISP